MSTMSLPVFVEQWVERLLSETPVDLGVCENPVCTLYVGSPGAGKSHHIALTQAGMSSVLVDSDVIGRRLGSLTPEERYRISKDIANAFLQRLFEQKRSMVIEGTGANFQACAGIILRARDLGYAMRVVWVKESLGVCVDRNEKRENPLPDWVVVSKWEASERNAPLLGGIADEFITVNSDTDNE